MAKLTDSALKDLLPNSQPGSKNHYISDCPLPSCGESGHFYIQRDTQLWDCKKCKERGNIYSLLKKLNKLNLLQEGGRKIQFDNPIENKINLFKKENSITDEDLKPLPVRLPIGYKRVFDNQYLNDRGYSKKDFQISEVGKTRLVSKMREYVIIPVYEEGICAGYLARSEKSKEEISLINDKYKELGEKKKYLRWRNSTSSDFSKLLYGLDEVIEGETTTVILVEGVFARRVINKLLKLNDTVKVKCCATFGKSISKYQVAKLVNKGVEQVILFFDPDAVSEIKTFSFELEFYFNVLIAMIDDSEDIDYLTKLRLNEILDQLKTPFEFFNSRVDKKLRKNGKNKGHI